MTNPSDRKRDEKFELQLELFSLVLMFGELHSMRAIARSVVLKRGFKSLHICKYPAQLYQISSNTPFSWHNSSSFFTSSLLVPNLN